MWQKSLTVMALCIASIAASQAQQGEAADQEKTLISEWLSLPDLVQIDWPYAFIRVQATQTEQEEYFDDLIKQIDELHWRLKEKGYATLTAAIAEWKKELSKHQHYREPGDWSPGWLMAHPRQRPPLERVMAIGHCRIPRTIQVWDETGVHDIAWHAGIHLSDVLKKNPSLKGGVTDMVAIVWPKGHIDHYGVAAWNKADTELLPGTRIIGVIDLKGEVFPWMRDAIASLLAHIPSGRDCRTITLKSDCDDEV